MPINESFKIPFFKLLVFSSVIAFLNSTFILYKGTSECLANTKLAFPDYMLTIMFFVNNFKHLLLLSGDIDKLNQARKDHLTLNFVIVI